VVIDAERGLVLTNSHVVRNAQRIGVALSDGRCSEAKLVGTDPPTDLALLSITPQRLVGLAFEDSDRLEISDYIVAMRDGSLVKLKAGVATAASSAPRRSTNSPRAQAIL
jgi:S1-C subfamily serine protease